MKTDIKIKVFLKNTLLLKKLGIIPLLYGSLGLEYLTGKDLNADDIDILIPKIFITEKWDEFKMLLEDDGYKLIDEHEHTFEKENIHFSYAQIEELEAFANINTSEIKTRKEKNIYFKLLSLQQYLKVYRASIKDGYRVNIRGKKDKEKIQFIEQCIKNENIK